MEDNNFLLIIQNVRMKYSYLSILMQVFDFKLDYFYNDKKLFK